MCTNFHKSYIHLFTFSIIDITVVFMFILPNLGLKITMSFKQIVVFLKILYSQILIKKIFTVYNIADIKTKMIKSTLKKKEASLTNSTDKMCTKNNKTFSFNDQCKRNTKEQFDDLKLGKFVYNIL